MAHSKAPQRSSRWLRRLVAAVPHPAETAAPRRTAILDVELSAPPSALVLEGFEAAHVLVLLHGQPLGTVHVEVRDGVVEPAALRAAIDAAVGDAEREHLRRDGLSAASAGGPQPPPCLRELEPPDPAPAVTVVIATRDRTEQLRRCLHSLAALDYPDFEVVVVDNAPSDSSTRACVEDEHGGDPRFRYVMEPRAGVSNARNVGAHLGRGEIVAFTDDDVLAHPLWLRALVHGFAGDPRVTCVTGLTLPGTLETAAEQAFEDYGGMALGYERRVFDLDIEDPPVRLYPYSAGIFGASNNAAFRRDAFLAHDGFDLTLGPGTPAFGAEDLDLFLAVILAGERIVYDPRAMVRHEHRSDFDSLYWQVFTYSAGMTAFLTKWLFKDRRVAGDLVRRVPPLLPAALLNVHRGEDTEQHGEYLPQLRWLERAGFLYGPVAYARSRAQRLRAT